MQALTINIRLFPDNPELLRQLSREYIQTVNALTERAEKEGSFPKVTTKDVNAHLPSAVLNQAIRDAKSVSKKMKKEGKRPILKKPVYFVNNQNYTIGEQMIAFPIMLDGKTRKTRFRAIVTERDNNLIQHAKLGLMRIVEKSGKWYAQVSLSIPVTKKKNEKVMGVDLHSHQVKNLIFFQRQKHGILSNENHRWKGLFFDGKKDEGMDKNDSSTLLL
ncbi:hypothetical protein [Parageobacillus toebii]|nr:hypothetical protein [Parageobacillus toebii]